MKSEGYLKYSLVVLHIFCDSGIWDKKSQIQDFATDFMNVVEMLHISNGCETLPQNSLVCPKGGAIYIHQITFKYL